MGGGDPARLLRLFKELRRRQEEGRIHGYYPESGPLSRRAYHRQMAFFEAGQRHRERLILAANRVGKTEGVGGYEMTLHLTGEYPDWWPGRRFSRPIKAWAAGDTTQTVRDIIQMKLLGPPGRLGTGLIPKESIVDIKNRGGGAVESVDTIRVAHACGGESRLVLKSYDQKRKAFQGTEQDVVWLDEEPPLAIYTECLLRTMTTGGLVMCTFTPLMGMTGMVLHYLPGGRPPQSGERDMESGRFVVMAGWDDAPHLSEADKREMLKSMSPADRAARSRGIPSMGSGAIYPVPEEDFVEEPFEIPTWWPRLYGLDVGWNRTAALWGAWDREADTVHLYAEHYRGQAEPSIHAAAIRARGVWIPGVVDPAARGRSQRDGKSLLQDYRDLGLALEPADNGVEAGIQRVFERLSTGRLKVFEPLRHFLEEIRMYRRDDAGRIVKTNDHLLDALRYLAGSLNRAVTKPVARPFDGDRGPMDRIIGY